jgi:hypothetical protein
MELFMKKLAGLAIVTLIVLELLVRAFHLHSDLNRWQSGEGGYYYKNEPGQSGYCVRGGMGQIAAPYRVNSDGWISDHDYQSAYNKPLISIVGGSGVESLFNPSKHHISHFLKEQNTDVEVHEYGMSGGTFHTSAAIIQNEQSLENSDIIFIMHNVDKYYSTGFFALPDPAGKYQTFAYKAYTNFKLMVYLNVNHKLLLRENNGPRAFPFCNLDLETGFEKALNVVNQNCNAKIVLVINRSFLHEEAYLLLMEKLVKRQIPYIDLTDGLLNLKASGRMYDFGFDHHFNPLGNQLVASEMNKYLQSIGL